MSKAFRKLWRFSKAFGSSIAPGVIAAFGKAGGGGKPNPAIINPLYDPHPNGHDRGYRLFSTSFTSSRKRIRKKKIGQ